MHRLIRAYVYGMTAAAAYFVWLGGSPEIVFAGQVLLQHLSLTAMVWFVVERRAVARALADDEDARRALTGRASSLPQGEHDANESPCGIISASRSAFSRRSPSGSPNQSACSQKHPYLR